MDAAELKNKRREKLRERHRQEIKAVRADPNFKLQREARWLDSSYRFDQNFLLSSRKKMISNQLLKNLITGTGKTYKLDQKQLDFEVICANLLTAHNQKQPVSISMNSNSWGSGKRWRTSNFIIKGVNMLADNGFIKMKKGYQYKNQARHTRIWATEKLNDLFNPLEIDDIQFKPVDIVNLHDKNKKLIDYKDNSETMRVRNILRKVNIVNSQFLAQFIFSDRGGMAHKMDTNLHAVYNCDFKHGGRLYTGTADGYQGLSKEERLTILIDNKKTIELDFDGFHPRILYTWEGIQYDGDPYSAILPNDPELRPIFKKVFLALLNAKDEVDAVKVGNQYLYENRKYYKLMTKKNLKIKNDIIPMFQKTHARIAHYFCKGSGLRVMNLDSKIALDILKYFANKNIPILCIHDSFITYKYLKDELKKVMQAAYKRKTKGFSCPVS